MSLGSSGSLRWLSGWPMPRQAFAWEVFHAARLSTAGQMAAALAHELNQPLAAAANFVNAACSPAANLTRSK